MSNVPDGVGEVCGCRQGGPHVGGQGPVRGVGADGERRVQTAKRVFDDDVVAVRGEEDSDGGAVAVLGFAEQVIDGVDVEVELADVFGLGVADFQLEDDEAAQAQVEEQQIEEIPTSEFDGLFRFPGYADVLSGVMSVNLRVYAGRAFAYASARGASGCLGVAEGALGAEAAT